jgi:hypothetical protein
LEILGDGDGGNGFPEWLGLGAYSPGAAGFNGLSIGCGLFGGSEAEVA